MNDADLGEALSRVHLEQLRTRILMLLDKSYPDSEHSDVIFLRLEHDGINQIVKELHYLSEKGLVRMERVVEERFMCSITAQGRDVVSGHVEVLGVASPAIFP